MSQSRSETTVAVGCCLAATMCFSSAPVFLWYLTGYLDSWTVNAVRYGTAALRWGHVGRIVQRVAHLGLLGDVPAFAQRATADRPTTASPLGPARCLAGFRGAAIPPLPAGTESDSSRPGARTQRAC
jgi:hypothetical protein